jgi:hypothetical protein
VYPATLPHGVLCGTARRHDVLLRRPTGADEALLVEELAGATAAERASALLARCVGRIGGEPAGLDDVRALTVGDREALMLALRAVAFGERLACVLDCPHCGERMDLELSVSELLEEPYGDVREAHELALAGGGHVRFRLPTGADQEVAGAASDVQAGARLLLERCVLEVDGEADYADALGDAMARLDPQAEVRLAATCPSCAEPVDALLDAATLLLDELAGDAEDLFGEVHALARHYHWSESEILGLDLARRRRYLNLLVADETTAGVEL